MFRMNKLKPSEAWYTRRRTRVRRVVKFVYSKKDKIHLNFIFFCGLDFFNIPESGSWVSLLIYILDFIIHKLRIHLSRRNIGMT